MSRDSSSTGAPTVATASTSSRTTETSDGSTLSLSGLLNSLDGVAAAEGRYVSHPYEFITINDVYSLLFATTNHIERLDPALSRPGRMDVWVNFTHATKWQAEGIFKCFFPCKPASNDTASDAAPIDASPIDASQQNLPLPKGKAPAHIIPLLSEEEISELAKRFAAAIPEDELSVSLTIFKQTSYISLMPFCHFGRLLAFKGIFSRTRHVLVNVLTKLQSG